MRFIRGFSGLPANNDKLLDICLREANPDDLVKVSRDTVASTRNEDNHVASVEELPIDEVNEIYAALPSIGVSEDDKQDFVQREKTVKTEKTAVVVTQDFPPKNVVEKPNAAEIEERELENGDLQVVRFLPEGEMTGSVPQVSVTFSQSMVPLTTVDQIEALNVPVSIEPKVEGSFQWLGTKTLVFKPKYRFPMSTAFTVTVNKQLATSIKGKQLKDDFVFGFSTPTAKVKRCFPSDAVSYPINELPYFSLEFDQRIDPQQVISLVSCGKFRTQLMSAEQVKQELASTNLHQDNFSTYLSRIKHHIENSPEERHLWFKVLGTVGYSEQVVVTVEKGVPSLEGPLKTTEKFSTSATNYGAFQVTCKYPDTPTPLQQLSIQFTNLIDLELLDVSLVTIEPAIDNFKVDASPNTLLVNGRTKGGITYTITIGRAFKDIYGQELTGNNQVQFTVGPAAQSLQSFYHNMITLDPTSAEKPTYSVVTVNLKKCHIIVSQVNPAEYKQHIAIRNNNSDELKIPGTIVYDQVVDVDCQPDEPVETVVDLLDHLQFPRELLGQLFVYAEPVMGDWTTGEFRYRPSVFCWVQSTRLCVDAFNIDNNTIGWATSLADGSTVTNSTFQFDGIVKESNEQGMVQYTRSSNHYDSVPFIVKKGNDIAFCAIYGNRNVYPTYSASLFTDRGIYKPKETVSVKGYIRDLSFENGACSLHIPQTNVPLEYKAYDPRGQEFASGSATVSQFGSFNFTFSVPDNVNLGSHARIDIRNAKYQISTYFSLQEFRTPEFKASSSVPVLPYIVNQSTIATVSAGYYSGGGLNGATVSYSVSQTQSSYSPPGWHKYSFARITSVNAFGEQKEFTGKTDNNGEHTVAIDFQETDRANKGPVTVTLNASVQDINRQTIGTSTSFIVHPSSLYVGVKSDKYFVKPDEVLPLRLVVTKITGKVVADVPMKIKVFSQKYERKGYKYELSETLISEGDAVSKLQPLDYELKLPEGGRYKILVEIQDENGLPNATELTTFVYGGKPLGEAITSVQAEQATLIADKEVYEPGDVAEIFIQAPFQGPAEGILFALKNGIRQQIKFAITEGTCTCVQFPIQKEDIPGLSLQVAISGTNLRSFDPADNLPPRPAYADGSIFLSVATTIHNLTVEAEPEDKIVAPGTSTKVTVKVSDHSGVPISGSEVTLVVVDEAVLSLVDHRITNPLDQFYINRPAVYSHFTQRNHIIFKNWSSINISPPPQPVDDLMFNCFSASSTLERGSKFMARGRMLRKSSFGDADGGAADTGPEFKLRSNFNPLAVFVTSAVTDDHGKVIIDVALPDSLTQYRVTAVAVSKETMFGLGESSITAQLPVSIRPSLPRFLNFGDKAQFACVLQNQTEKTLTVNVAARASNLLVSDESKRGYKVSVPSLARVELRFPMQTDKCGTARFQIGAYVKTTGVRFTDAVERSLPVFTPSTSEAFATYGEIDDNGAVIQNVAAPENVWPQFGELSINSSSTALSSLTDAFLYLLGYEFQCTEQLSSRIMSIIALKDVLHAFNVPEIPSQEELLKYVTNGLNELYKAQKPDGSYSFWYNNDLQSSPFVTIHVAQCFVRCKQANIAVNANNFSSIITVLKDIERIIPSWYSEVCRVALKANALFVLALNGERDILQQARALYNNKKSLLSLEGLAWVAVAMFIANGNRADEIVNMILKEFMNRVNETAETANFVTSYGDRQSSQLVMLHSERRTDAILLEALMIIKPQDTLIPKLVKGLLAHKKKGRWNNTQENVYVLMALNRYFKQYESKEPDFVAKVWLGDDYAGEQSFKGRETKEKKIGVPMKYLMRSASQPLLIDKQGPGRMYYRLGLTYAPKDLFSAARECGFFVSRTYEAVTDKSHVTKEDGTWVFKAGELVRVKITIANVSRRYHVALVDKLPGGLEVMNPELKTTGAIPQDPSSAQTVGRWWYRRTWYEHQNLRDERVEAFTSLLWEGTHSYSYVCRATSIGEFVVPATTVEEMYSPEIFGRCASDRVVIRE